MRPLSFGSREINGLALPPDKALSRVTDNLISGSDISACPGNVV